jgi:iron-sulfur cluster assembly protein
VAITMTDSAIERVVSLKMKRQTPEATLRIGIRGGGCSGLTYFMDFVAKPEEKDKIFEFPNGVKIAIDRKSYLFLNGTEIDFTKEMMRTGFQFNNPLASRSCSCGESFSL